ncbi:conserved hypothetical protein [Ricinus communis]|uniref:Uncharacterized protein n=1 Tax=Ricinus communis TaxID=3988 RepID=B9TDC9_RICCO|nr:conserved hypothetical protein [Ricinus communis]
MTKPKTLTLSVKKPAARASAAPLVVPKTTLSYVIDNEEAASKVTVVKKKTRLSAAAEAALADVQSAEVADAPAKTVKVARKSAAAAVADEAPAVTVKAAPKSKLVKAKAEPAPVIVTTSPTAPAVSQVTDAAALAAIDTSGYLLPGVKVPGRRGRKPSEFTPENDEVAALNAVERAELKPCPRPASARPRAATCWAWTRRPAPRKWKTPRPDQT